MKKVQASLMKPKTLVNPAMTIIESIYEMQAALIELLERLPSKSAWVSKHAQIKYEKLVDRFFRENVNFVKPGQRQSCLDDPACFLNLMEEAVAHYYEEMN